MILLYCLATDSLKLYEIVRINIKKCLEFASFPRFLWDVIIKCSPGGISTNLKVNKK